MTFVRTLLAVLVVASTAQADVWKRATDPEPQIDIYEALITKGDEAAVAANSRSINLQTILKTIDIAVDAYRGAAKARPKSGEPHFRIASVLNSFFFDCLDPLRMGNLPRTCHSNLQTNQRARETLEAWDTFESLAPLDPRVNEILLARAILRTKLVASTPKPEALLRAAAKDYQALIDREDGLYSGSDIVLGNLAETHMMLGNIDEAIDAYRLAIRAGGKTSTIYGLAVALDRDERGEQAMALIRAQGAAELVKFQEQFDLGHVFFVPTGEEEYYFGLAQEAFGNVEDAISHWRGFIRSGAHPQFQPRAKEHLDKLMARKNLKWKVPITPDLEDSLPNPKRRLRK
jgi:tetratricopeptide (TPR) repeat protein